MNTLLKKLYSYNAWANADLFDKLESLDKDRQSVELHTSLRLVSHYHVVSRIFAAHLAGVEHGYTSDNIEDTPNLGDLRAAVTSSDQWYLDYVSDATAVELAQAVAFAFTDGDPGLMTREEMLTHVALHGGYHRGEIGRILWQISITPPWDAFTVYLHQSEPERRVRDGRELL